MQQSYDVVTETPTSGVKKNKNRKLSFFFPFRYFSKGSPLKTENKKYKTKQTYKQAIMALQLRILFIQNKIKLCSSRLSMPATLSAKPGLITTHAVRKSTAVSVGWYSFVCPDSLLAQMFLKLFISTNFCQEKLKYGLTMLFLLHSHHTPYIAI